jgi:hypothetical protein
MKKCSYSVTLTDLKRKMEKRTTYTCLQLMGFYGELALENWARQNGFIFKRLGMYGIPDYYLKSRKTKNSFFVESKLGHINFTTSQKITFYLMLLNKLKIKIANSNYYGEIIFKELNFKGKALELNATDMFKHDMIKIKRKRFVPITESFKKASERFKREKEKYSKLIENLTPQEKRKSIEDYFQEYSKSFHYNEIVKILKKILKASTKILEKVRP